MLGAVVRIFTDAVAASYRARAKRDGISRGAAKGDAACQVDAAPHRTVGPDGRITSIDISTTVFVSSTLEPALTREQRSKIARRAIAAIAARKKEHDRALMWLEPLDDAIASVLRGKVLLELGREADAMHELEQASERGVAEATLLVSELRRDKALRSRPPTVAPTGDDFELDARVAHEKFGEGKVVDVEGTGHAARVTIELADGTTRTLPGRALRAIS